MDLPCDLSALSVEQKKGVRQAHPMIQIRSKTVIQQYEQLYDRHFYNIQPCRQ